MHLVEPCLSISLCAPHSHSLICSEECLLGLKVSDWKISCLIPEFTLFSSLQCQSIAFYARQNIYSVDYPRTNSLINSILCHRKMAPDKLNRQKGHFFKTIAIGGERLNSAPRKQKAEGFLSTGLNQWKGSKELGRGWYMIKSSVLANWPSSELVYLSTELTQDLSFNDYISKGWIQGHWGRHYST